ncbi:MAG: TerD family protein [Clostridiales bacterium]|nr:TerD family protein [Clostridiales bacterium]
MIDTSRMNRVTPALTRQGLAQGFGHIQPAWRRDNVSRVNLGKQWQDAPARQPVRAQQAAPAPRPAPAPVQAVRDMATPRLEHELKRGQKAPLGVNGGAVRCGFGWNVRDPRCDIDVSAFLLKGDRRVPGDDWFVFYGQPKSPDGSVTFSGEGAGDRESIRVDLTRLDPAIERIVFVMTINEALSQRLNFGMIRDAYLRVMTAPGEAELLSFRVSEYYENVTSMTLGELYLHKGEWRFNPVGNGLAIDLAGQCAVYGVAIE